MATVITIAQQKGGAGKTSLVAHLAGYWAGRRKKVALLDLDPQESLGAWFGLRRSLHGDDPWLSLRPSSGWRASTEVRRVAGEADIVLVDCPPHAETSGRVAIRSADMPPHRWRCGSATSSLTLASVALMSFGSPDSAAQRNGPTPRQNSGRI